MGGSAFVEHKSLPHSDPPTIALYHFVTASGFPEPGSSGTIGARPSGVLLVFVAKEVPIILRGGTYFTHLCNKPKIKPNIHLLETNHSKKYIQLIIKEYAPNKMTLCYIN